MNVLRRNLNQASSPVGSHRGSRINSASKSQKPHQSEKSHKPHKRKELHRFDKLGKQHRGSLNLLEQLDNSDVKLKSSANDLSTSISNPNTSKKFRKEVVFTSKAARYQHKPRSKYESRMRTQTVTVDLHEASGSSEIPNGDKENYLSSSTELEESDTMESIDEALPPKMNVYQTKQTHSIGQYSKKSVSTIWSME